MTPENPWKAREDYFESKLRTSFDETSEFEIDEGLAGKGFYKVFKRAAPHGFEP